jgi:hypothetical protein
MIKGCIIDQEGLSQKEDSNEIRELLFLFLFLFYLGGRFG